MPFVWAETGGWLEGVGNCGITAVVEDSMCHSWGHGSQYQGDKKSMCLDIWKSTKRYSRGTGLIEIQQNSFWRHFAKRNKLVEPCQLVDLSMLDILIHHKTARWHLPSPCSSWQTTGTRPADVICPLDCINGPWPSTVILDTEIHEKLYAPLPIRGSISIRDWILRK